MKLYRIARLGLIIFTLFLVGCSPTSLEDYQHEGEAFCRALTKELQEIQTKEDLVKATPKLRERFLHLVDLIMEARMFQEQHPEEKSEDFFRSHQVSESLKAELKRIYQIEGAKEIVENAEREALIKLDGFEKKRQKRKSSLLR